jgi:N-acetylglucosaminyldiphosphoundecaprenol N-acetyl-beta-D-mannosaminyltransferase
VHLQRPFGGDRHADPAFLSVLRQADMATPDGAPVAWMMRRLGHPQQQRINAPT